MITCLSKAMDPTADLAEYGIWIAGFLNQTGPAFWFGLVNLGGLGKKVSSLAVSLGILGGMLTYIMLLGVLLSQVKKKKDCNGYTDDGIFVQYELYTEEECVSNPHTAYIDMFLFGPDVWAGLVNFLITAVVSLILPESMGDVSKTNPRAACMRWDIIPDTVLSTYGSEYLTHDKVQEITGARRLPVKDNSGIVCGLGAIFVTIVTMPIYYFDNEVTETFIFGAPAYFMIQLGGVLVVVAICVFNINTNWDASEDLVTSVGKLLKVIDAMDVKDVREWVAKLDPEFAAYAGAFEKNAIDGQSLRSLKLPADLEKLGVTQVRNNSSPRHTNFMSFLRGVHQSGRRLLAIVARSPVAAA